MQIDLPSLDKRVVIKGYRTGIGIFFDDESPFPDLLADLAASLERSNAFFIGAPVTLNVGHRELGTRELMALRDLLVERHRLLIAQVYADSPATRTAAERLGLKVSGTSPGVAASALPAGAAGVRPAGVAGPEGPGAAAAAVRPAAAAWGGQGSRRSVGDPAQGGDAAPAGAGPAYPEPPRVEGGLADRPLADTLTIRQTLRSGQRVDFPGHVLVIGDVNSGAEIVAGGDIVVFGVLRGLAHAGAPDNAGAVIVALGIHPPQLRIGTVISRGSEGPARRDGRERERELQPEIARIEGDTIVVEAFRGRI